MEATEKQRWAGVTYIWRNDDKATEVWFGGILMLSPTGSRRGQEDRGLIWFKHP
jgi:hypothetical protein